MGETFIIIIVQQHEGIYYFGGGGGAIDTPTFTPKMLSFRHVKNVEKIAFRGY